MRKDFVSVKGIKCLGIDDELKKIAANMEDKIANVADIKKAHVC